MSLHQNNAMHSLLFMERRLVKPTVLEPSYRQHPKGCFVFCQDILKTSFVSEAVFNKCDLFVDFISGKYVSPDKTFLLILNDSILLGKCGGDLKGNGYFSVILGLLHQ